ncbi:hypothetical protein [Spirulina sp. 06S082]|uniref:hypothetical protein n=1 Tax=Spirulina sp. 06S082 TaxID=3110248 RepID=UPI002B1F619E|nr:hypothetical protein [Spirulina sp. 06S082]MEA5470658.1 hypothetical protein [Spirulina sp. 06S082]
MSRTLKVSPECIKQVKFSLPRHNYSTVQELAEDSQIARSTVSNFLNGKPVLTRNFLELCHFLDLDSEQISGLKIKENKQQDYSINAQNIDSIKRQSNITIIQLSIVLDTQDEVAISKLPEILKQIKEISGDTSMNIENIEKGSIVLKISGSKTGCERLNNLFRSGQLTELLGIEILDLALELPEKNLIQLGQWLQNQFIEAEKAQWVTINEIFGTQQFAFRNNGSPRAKQVKLGEKIINLILNVEDLEEEISIIFGIYPNRQEPLPQNLNVVVFGENEQILIEIPLANYPNGVVQELFFDPGEAFHIEMTLDNQVYLESFIIERVF